MGKWRHRSHWTYFQCYVPSIATLWNPWNPPKTKLYLRWIQISSIKYLLLCLIDNWNCNCVCWTNFHNGLESSFLWNTYDDSFIMSFTLNININNVVSSSLSRFEENCLNLFFALCYWQLTFISIIESGFAFSYTSVERKEFIFLSEYFFFELWAQNNYLWMCHVTEKTLIR